MLSKLRIKDKRGKMNMKYTEGAVVGVLFLAILSAISLYVLVTVLDLSIFNNITQVSTIKTNVLDFVSNAFALVATAGTFVGLAILLAVIVVAFIYLKKMANSGSRDSSGFAG